MGSGDVMAELPALPDGFVMMEQPQSGMPPLPEGFVMMGDVPPPAAPAPRGALDQLTGATGERYQTWPERLVRGIGESVKSGVTLPGDVYAGEANPNDTGRVLDLAGIASPVSPGARLGSRYGAPPAPRELTAGELASATATNLGAPLPKGLASDRAPVQAVTQASRQLPFVGQQIDERVGNTVAKAGEAVTDLAGTLGATDRATAGANLRPSLEGVIADNKDVISASYNGVRGMIDPQAAFIPQNTKAVLADIVRARTEAGQPKPTAGLEQIENLVNNGVNFNGLIRAKSDLSQSVDFLAAHAGFSNADKKRLGAALSRDVGEITAQAARPGVKPQSVVSELRSAEAEASKIITDNKSIQSILANKRDEGVIGSVISAADGKTGNLKQIALLKRSMAPDQFEKIAGVALSELGHNPATGEFSLAKFATSWDKMNPRARELMFPGQHGQFLSDIAQLGKHLKGGDQFRNTSGTGRAAMLGGMVATTGSALVAAAMGQYAPILGLGGSVAGGYLLAKGLARPAAAASMARVSRTALAYQHQPSLARKSTLLLASKNALDNLSTVNNVTPAEFLRLLQSPMKSAAQPDQPEAPRNPP